MPRNSESIKLQSAGSLRNHLRCHEGSMALLDPHKSQAGHGSLENSLLQCNGLRFKFSRLVKFVKLRSQLFVRTM